MVIVGLDIYLYVDGAAHEPKSETNPEHLSNRGYLRSSYNDGGFNRVSPTTFYDIFADFYEIFADVIGGGGCKHRLKPEHIEALRKAADKARAAAEAMPRYMALSTMARHTRTEARPVDVLLSEMGQERHPEFSSYSNSLGDFFLDGITVYAVMGPVLVIGMDDDTHTHYRETALIAAEFCEEAIAQIEAGRKVKILWSA